MIKSHSFCNPFMENVALYLRLYVHRDGLRAQAIAVWVVVFRDVFISFLLNADLRPLFSNNKTLSILPTYISFPKKKKEKRRRKERNFLQRVALENKPYIHAELQMSVMFFGYQVLACTRASSKILVLLGNTNMVATFYVLTAPPHPHTPPRTHTHTPF